MVRLSFITPKKELSMFSKFFNLKCVDKGTGVAHRASWIERLKWLASGCPLRDEAVVQRFCEKKHPVTINGEPLTYSNTYIQ